MKPEEGSRLKKGITDCPCKRLKCARHADCAACTAHHEKLKRPPICERPGKGAPAAEPKQNADAAHD